MSDLSETVTTKPPRSADGRFVGPESPDHADVNHAAVSAAVSAHYRVPAVTLRASDLDPGAFYTLSEVAAVLRVSRSSVDRLVKAGLLRRVNLKGLVRIQGREALKFFNCE